MYFVLDACKCFGQPLSQMFCRQYGYHPWSVRVERIYWKIVARMLRPALRTIPSNVMLNSKQERPSLCLNPILHSNDSDSAPDVTTNHSSYRTLDQFISFARKPFSCMAAIAPFDLSYYKRFWSQLVDDELGTDTHDIFVELVASSRLGRFLNPFCLLTAIVNETIFEKGSCTQHWWSLRNNLIQCPTPDVFEGSLSSQHLSKKTSHQHFTPIPSWS